MSRPFHLLFALGLLGACSPALEEGEEPIEPEELYDAAARDTRPPERRDAARVYPPDARTVSSDGGVAPDATGSSDGGPVAPVAIAGSRIFDRTVLHQITLEVAPADLAKVREGSGSTRISANMTLDGMSLEKVGIRRKGFYGSQSTSKPALSVKLDHFVAGQEYDGLDKIVLNNEKQDPSLL